MAIYHLRATMISRSAGRSATMSNVPRFSMSRAVTPPPPGRPRGPSGRVKPPSGTLRTSTGARPVLRIPHDAGYPINVSVNLSPRQFHSKALLPAIAEIAATNGFDPSRFDLEITESMLMGDNDRAIDALRRIDEMGFNLAIDDFGTGYSNLVYLQKYPIRCLKIDRSFIADLNKTSAIAELIISMCKLLDVKIIAEGVENETQLGWLKERGCHAYQGFVFSRPISAVAFESSFLTPGTFTEESGGDSSRRQFSASA